MRGGDYNGYARASYVPAEQGAAGPMPPSAGLATLAKPGSSFLAVREKLLRYCAGPRGAREPLFKSVCGYENRKNSFLTIF